MRGYRQRARAFNLRHPWLSGALFGLYMAAAQLVIMHPRSYLPLAFTWLLGFVVFGYFFRIKTQPDRLSQRDLVVILSVVAGVMVIVLAIQSFPR